MLVISDDVTEASGIRALDGEWVNGNSLTSGDGTAGGDFIYRFNVLPGDVDRMALFWAVTLDWSLIESLRPCHLVSPKFRE